MNAAQIIREIETLPSEERGKVIDFVHHLAQSQFDEEQIRIAEQRLVDFDKGLEEAVPHDEAMRMLREG